MNLTTPQLTEIARRVMARRYLVKNEAGKPVESPQQRFERVARHVAQAEKNYGNDPEAVWPMLYELMAQRDFLPNTPCLANAGRDEGTGQLSACFVLPVPDSMDGIFEAVKQQALIHKSGGGTGMAFSRLRPSGDFVRSTTGVSSGPITFMEIFDAATEGVKQGGIRRGANMGILRVDHPDILSFIRCKADTSKITNFNISVAITDAFMAALEQNGDYALVNPKSKLVTGRLRAHDVWQAIVEQAHATGEPGLFFIDRTNDLDPLSETLGPIEATNPCGEVPLRGHDACTLGSINLSNFFVESPVGSVGDEHYTYGTIDFERLAETVKRAVRFLDNVLDVNDYPVEEIYRVTGQSRKIGLGVMGWADLLIKLGIPYASKRALDIGRQVMRYVNDMAVQASEALAEEREPFPAWAGSKWAQRGEKPRRNSTVTVIAPTGSISIIAGCSSGIEPVFALSMVRNQAEMKMVDVHPLLEEVGRREGWWSSDLAEKVAANGSVQGIEYIPERWREVFKVAGEIDPAYHVAMQAAFQEHTEDAVSKTINLPQSARAADIEEAYLQAWQLGCKGITVYRDGCRPNQTLTPGSGKVVEGVAREDRRHIPASGRRQGVTITKKTALGSIHTTLTTHPDDGEPFEVFIDMGKSGSELRAFIEALGRTASLLLKVAPEPRKALGELAEQLARISGGEVHRNGREVIVSAPDGIAHAIRDFLDLAENLDQTHTRGGGDLCPDCGGVTLYRSEGCMTCRGCGFSRC